MSKRATQEQLRRMIPTERYIALMNEAVFTGRMPTYDRETGMRRKSKHDSVLIGAQRIEAIKYLMGKVMSEAPKLQSITVETKASSRALELSPDQLQSSSLAELEVLLIESQTADEGLDDLHQIPTYEENPDG